MGVVFGFLTICNVFPLHLACLEAFKRASEAGPRLAVPLIHTSRAGIWKMLLSIPGFGYVCASELAGEIGTVGRFGKEGSLALYIGMATLDNSSGKHQGSKRPRQVNTRAKAAMMTALDRHRKYVPESQRYYEKKRAQGKRHNQAIRALGRHLSRIIYKMLKEEREYQLRSAKGGTQSKVGSRSLLKRQIRRPEISANSQ